MIKAINGWRKGQTIFNFLWWLHDIKGIETEYSVASRGCTSCRQADVFYMSDDELNSYWEEYQSLDVDYPNGKFEVERV